MIRALDLAVRAGRKRQSPRTRFLHGEGEASDTIPTYENFCFAFALFRQKTTESVLEGKQWVERLLAFQTEGGNFPPFLHDFPRCWDPYLALKISPILIHLLREFSPVLNTEYKDLLETALRRALRLSEKISLPPLWAARLDAAMGKIPVQPPLSTAQEWFEWLVTAQLHNKEGPYPVPYATRIQCFCGEHPVQEKGEPQPVPIEYLLAQPENMGERLLRDHPHQIVSALLFPFIGNGAVADPIVILPRFAGGLRLLWEGKTLHSLLVPTGTWDGSRVFWDLPLNPNMASREDLFEIFLFCDISSETTLYIENQKGLIFHLGETLSIRTPNAAIDLRFELLEGKGDFLGHLSRENRPGQISQEPFATYDWKIGLRTLRRESFCRIALSIIPSQPV